ncbi:hypothetical protein Dimus_034804 [Dionaea muscipula]
MGNYKLALSDMIPNAWFYKLRDLTTTTTTTATTKSGKNRQVHSNKKKSASPAVAEHRQQQQRPKQKQQKQNQNSAEQVTAEPNPHLSHPRKSYYFARKFIIPAAAAAAESEPLTPANFLPESDPPRKSCKKGPTKRRKSTTKSSSATNAGSGCRTTDSLHSYRLPSEDLLHPQFSSEIPLPPKSRIPCSYSCRRRVDPLLLADHGMITALDVKSLAAKKKHESSSSICLDSASRIELAPIIATREKFNGNRGTTAAAGSTMRRFSVSSPASSGVRLRVNSPRIMSDNGRRRSSYLGARRRKSISESFAIVKSSFDPQRDFRESMVEMILENKIKGSKELEELLACYLSLNSDEYHDVIIKVFKQIWFDLNGIACK